MSVIWSGVTEQGAVVPVQVTAEGKVVAVGDGPAGEYLPITGGEITGDLDVDGSITAAGGKASINSLGSITSNPQVGAHVFQGQDGSGVDCVTIYGNGDIYGGENGADSEGANATYKLLGNGNITATKGIQVGGYDRTSNDAKGAFITDSGQFVSQKKESTLAFTVYYQSEQSPRAKIKGDGSAEFSGDVIIGSRGSKWLIRESNGVAMLIDQTLRLPRMQKIRDLPYELDLIEAALSEIMEKLKMTPPAGWPVWDGQSEVATDNDNA